MMPHGQRARRARCPVSALCLLAAGLVSLPAAAENGDREAIEALVREGRHPQALERLEEHLREDPDDAQARFLQGVALAELGRTDEAVAVFSRLAEERPELPEPHNNLAVLHALRGEYDEARGALQAAIDASPDDARYRENLGDLYANMAIAAYRRAAELGESSGRAEAKLELLRELLAGREGGEAGAATAATNAASGSGIAPAAPRDRREASGRVFRVQLASHEDRRRAERDLGDLRQAHPELLGRLPGRVERRDLGQRGVWYRVRLGEFAAAAEARALCRRLEDRGRECLVVAAGPGSP